MQLLTALKHTLGFHGCTLALEGVQGPVQTPGALQFSVLLRGGEFAVPVRALRVCLEEERLVYLDPAAGEYEYWDTVARTVVPLQRGYLGAYATLRVPVRLEVPALEPSAPLKRYRLLVVADIPGRNPRVSRLVELVERPWH
jgi:hypothetical protein